MELRIIFLMILFIFIYCDDDYETFTFDEAVEIINKVNYTENDYKKMISYIKNLFIKYYVYLDIAKNPPSPLKPFDLIKQLDSINTQNISYYDFFLKIHTSILLLQDNQIDISFKRIIDFHYVSPVKFIVKTENNKNYLYLQLLRACNLFYQQETCTKLYQNKDVHIKTINDLNPFDFIQTFGKYPILKSEQANFVYNLKIVYAGNLQFYPFIKSDFNNITIKFENDLEVTFNYTIYKIQNNNRRLIQIQPLENNKQNPLNYINLLETKNKNHGNNNNNTTRKLEETIWDYNYEGKVKLKIDNINKVNVIYIKTLIVGEKINNEWKIDLLLNHFFLFMNEKINTNNYPIIVIEDNDNGYFFYNIFKLLNVINSELSLNTLNIAQKNVNNSVYDIDDYGNEIKHNRTKVRIEDNIEHWVNFSSIKNILRKPNEIMVFTDGYGYSGLFIHNLQESGNAIIVGYNGNPSENKRFEKFAASVSCTSKDKIEDNIVNNLKEYEIDINGLPFKEYFDDSYINPNTAPIPHEYKLIPIDERSNIYGEYDDERYHEFVKEAKRIFSKYQTECNVENKNMVLLNDLCKFDDDIKIGGYSCIDGKWSNVCQISNCKKPYTFNTYNKSCVLSDIIKNNYYEIEDTHEYVSQCPKKYKYLLDGKKCVKECKYHLKDSLNCVSSCNNYIYKNQCLEDCGHTLYYKGYSKECIEKCDDPFKFQILNENICFSECPEKYPFITNNTYCSILDKEKQYMSYNTSTNFLVILVTALAIYIIILLFKEEYIYENEGEIENDLKKVSNNNISLSINNTD